MGAVSGEFRDTRVTRRCPRGSLSTQSWQRGSWLSGSSTRQTLPAQRRRSVNVARTRSSFNMQIEAIQPMLCAHPLLPHKAASIAGRRLRPEYRRNRSDMTGCEMASTARKALCRVIGGDMAAKVASNSRGMQRRSGLHRLPVSVSAASIASDGKAWHASFKLGALALGQDGVGRQGLRRDLRLLLFHMRGNGQRITRIAPPVLILRWPHAAGVSVTCVPVNFTCAANLRSVDLNLLTVFEAIYELGTVEWCRADHLALSQSATSHSLSRLERACRDDLFVRTRQGLSPTAVAKEMYPAIKQALDLPAHYSGRGRAGSTPAHRKRRFRIGIHWTSRKACVMA